MLLSVSLILWSLVLGPLVYYGYKIAKWYAGVRKRGRAVEQFPGEPKHWLWGHLHLFPGPGEDGLKCLREYTILNPRTQNTWRGPVEPILSIRHPETAKVILRSDGPCEEGLSFLRQYTALYPRIQHAWRGPIEPVVLIKHPETAKIILRSDGPDEAGLSILRKHTDLYPRIQHAWRGPIEPIVLIKHPETAKIILRSDGFNEAGLAYLRNRVEKYNMGERCWRGPFQSLALVYNPVTVKPLLLTSGPNEAGLSFLRKKTVKYKTGDGFWMGPFEAFALLYHPITLQPILRTSDTYEAGLAACRKYTAKHPRYQKDWRGPFLPVLVLKSPVARYILTTSEPKPLGLGVYVFGLPWLGEGLLISGGKKWARNRKLLTPAFHFDILKPYMAVNNQATEIFMEKLDAAADSNKSYEIFNHVSLLTLDVILRCAFSYENDCQVRGEKHPYVQAVCELGDLWVDRSLKPWLYIDFIYYLTASGRMFKKHCDFVHSVSEDIIAKRKKTLQEEGEAALNMKKGRYLDFLDILLTAKDDEGKGLDDKDIRAEVDTFLFEGHDTTASSISWMIYSMASHPEIQKRCQEEIDVVLEGRDSDEILWDDIPKLKYLTMCLKESMRLHTPVPFIERQLTKELVIDGKALPPGSIVAVQIYNLHHNPTVWKDPMEYQPDRFFPENIEKIDNYAFLPFSAGPRNCIGQNFAMHEQKTVLARILHRFTFELDPNKPVEKKIGVVMKTKDGMFLNVKHR